MISLKSTLSITAALAVCAAIVACDGVNCSASWQFNTGDSVDVAESRTDASDDASTGDRGDSTASSADSGSAGPAGYLGPVTTFGTYSATITTARGVIEIDLFNDIAHIYVDNFVTLAQSGFYDGVVWHRVIPGFVIQAGISPDGRQVAEFDDVFHPEMKHNDAGILSMANRGLNTNTSQFFITHGSTPHLDPYENGNPKPCGTPGISCHAVFGKVTSGIEAVFDTREGDVIDSITIHERSQ